MHIREFSLLDEFDEMVVGGYRRGSCGEAKNEWLLQCRLEVVDPEPRCQTSRTMIRQFRCSPFADIVANILADSGSAVTNDQT